MATAVATDGSNNIYVVGMYSKTAMVDSETGTVLTCEGDAAGFILKLNSDGKYITSVNITGTSTITNSAGVNCIAVDAFGNIYIGGTFSGKIYFNPESTSGSTAKGKLDGFLAAYDTTGKFRWVDRFGGLMNEEVTAAAIEVGGAIYLAGNFESKADLDPSDGVENHDSDGLNDIFLMKINSEGNRIWTKVLGGTGDDHAYGLSTDTNGFVAMCGSFEGSVNFNPNGVIERKTSLGEIDGFTVLFNTSGAFQWVRTFGGTGKDYCNDVMFDTAGNVYSVGAFSRTVNFAKSHGSTDSHKSNGLYDAFANRTGSTGGYDYTVTAGGKENDVANSIIQNKSSLKTYWAGSFKDTVDFNPDKTATEDHNAFGAEDCFLVNMTHEGDW